MSVDPTNLLPLASHLYLKYRGAVNDENQLLTEGTIWFCDQDKTFGLKMENQIKYFGTNIILNNVINNARGVVDEIAIIEKLEHLNLNAFREYNQEKNILYLVKEESAIVLFMNGQIIFSAKMQSLPIEDYYIDTGGDTGGDDTGGDDTGGDTGNENNG